MKAILFALAATLAVATASLPVTSRHHGLLGAQECTWGPTHWCKDIQTSARCNATKHCIKTQWLTRKVPEDNDSVCDICKDMVKQARDQLESNQTMEDLKNVFEGSCRLMMVKPVIKICDELVDEFIPELVETLASQMDPSVVCSVSGLCNSKKIDQLIAEHEAQKISISKSQLVSLENDELKPDSCSGCYTIATHMADKFKKQSKDSFLNHLLAVCGQLGSFSDACSSLVIVHFNEIHTRLNDDLTAKNICHLSGQCTEMYHHHENSTMPAVEIRPLSTVGIVDIGDELPCKLCVQLVGHLRDLLVANTTETEFKQILQGMCKQTKSFAAECTTIVDEYYSLIYDTLTHKLNGSAICIMASICPSPDKETLRAPYMPLLPPKSVKIGSQLLSHKKQKNIGEHGSGIRKTEAEQMQLPLERFGNPMSVLLMPNMDVNGQKMCVLCETLLHYVQQAITDPSFEGEVEKVLDKVCDKFPKSITGTCDEFVDTYKDAIIALLAQEIDPSEVCPRMHVCPSAAAIEMWEKLPKDLMVQTDVEEKASCPFCLMAVKQLEDVIGNDKTEENIEHQLDKLCSHLRKELYQQCASFVKSYSTELIKMLIADLTPQEVCVYVKFCDANKITGPSYSDDFPLDKDGEIATNEIPDVPTSVQKNAQVGDNTKCVICELIMKYLEDEMKNESTKKGIKRIVEGICHHLPTTVSKECDNFVKEYADLVIDMLSSEITPREICTRIDLCQTNLQRIIDSIGQCALCQGVISSIDRMLVNPKIDHDIDLIVGRVCKDLSPSKQGKCTELLEVYEKSFINLIKAGVDTKKVCTKLTLCSSGDFYSMSSGLFRNRQYNL